jgi:hypothetical protein
MMNYEILFAEIFAGCLFATAAIVFRVRLEKVRSSGVRTKVSRHASRIVPFRTK